MKLAVIIVFLGALAIAYAQLYALWDVLVRHSEMSFVTRVGWCVAMLAFPVFGTIAYLRMGPGEARWPPWDAE